MTIGTVDIDAQVREMEINMIIGDQLGDIREKALEAKAILDEIDKLYEPLRDGYSGSVDEGTGDSDQQIQIATMHLNDGIMLLKNEMSGLKL